MFENISESDLICKISKYTDDFNADALLEKVTNFAKKAGCKGIQAALGV